MKNFWKIVDEVIKKSEVLLIVLDARNAEESRNKEIEQKIKKSGKKIIYVLNKMDLVHPKDTKKIKLSPCVMVSAKFHKGNMVLLRALSRMTKGKQTTIGVLGYPNTGKSSIINSLKGKASSKTSSMSGYTKALQKVRVSKNIVLLDTPGVFPKSEFDQAKHALIGAKDVHKLKDAEDVAAELIEKLEGKIEKHYNLMKQKDGFDALEKIAEKLRFLKKQGKRDTVRAAKQVIDDLQKGRIVLEEN